ncbi:MAG TPA: hypothetical protein VEC11_08280 [Allosphingosinicella sp.]|nr:hypothetical protein [Allosphingosinicella sp.]
MMTEEQYLMLCQRRQGFDSFVWQTPPLAIAAQAFLLTASFDHDTTRWVAVLLAIFSGLLGAASVQLLMKHRLCEIEDSERLRVFEEANAAKGYAVLHGPRGPVAGVPRNWIVRRSSFRVWTGTLLGFVGLAIVAAITAVIG